jgi:hypothetical protein
MKAIWDACKKAGVEPPKEVRDFFGYGPPDDAGVEVKLELREWHDDSRSGYELDIDKLPKNITVIRFYNSY